MFNPREPRDAHGQWVRLIHASDLSTPDARRSPAVSEEEFRQHAERGRAKLAALSKGGSEPVALKGAAWDKIVSDAFAASRDPWGGVTVDSHTGAHVAPDADKYALTMRNPGTAHLGGSYGSVHVPPTASKTAFKAAMNTARSRFSDELSRPGAHLGVFHDADTGTIDIDPVLVTGSLDDVHDIGAYTHAVGGAYHFKSGDGFWPPHVKDTKDMSIQTPVLSGEFDLSLKDGKIAFWKQILPQKSIHYTAKDGRRSVLNFDRQYLTDLATNKAVDEVGFLLADVDNRHTMDPERWRGTVAEWEIRDNQPNPDHNGLYGKIVFPNAEAAKAVLSNPNLGVSARIREGVERSDGSQIARGIIHVLGTLDPQVSGMAGWQTADLSAETDTLLDLTAETYEDETMADSNRSVTEFTEDEIAEMSDDEFTAFLAQAEAEFEGILDEVANDLDADDEVDEDESYVRSPEVVASLSNDQREQIDLANSRANRALRELAQARWDKTRDAYMNAGVPVDLLDLAEPIFNRPSDFVVDLSNEGTAGEVHVGEIVSKFLDALKGTIDLSAEAGHSGTFRSGDGEDPDKALLDMWNAQQG